MKSGFTKVTLEIPVDVHRKIKVWAAAQDRRMGAALVRLLRETVANVVVPPAPVEVESRQEYQEDEEPFDPEEYFLNMLSVRWIPDAVRETRRECFARRGVGMSWLPCRPLSESFLEGYRQRAREAELTAQESGLGLDGGVDYGLIEVEDGSAQ